MKSFLLSVVLLLLSLPALASNPQLVAGGSAVTVSLTGGIPPSGETAPPVGTYSIWEGSTCVVPNTSLSSVPVTTNGVTVTSASGSVNYYSSLTLQMSSSSSVPSYAGASLIVSCNAQTFTTPIDLTGVSAPAPTLQSVTISPASLTGSSTSAQSVTITATLSAPAPDNSYSVSMAYQTSGGYNGSLSATNAMTFAAGQTQVSESGTVGASPYGGTITVSGQLTSGGSTQSGVLTISSPAAGSSGSTLYVYGAGTSIFNGTYTPNRTYNGATVYDCAGNTYMAWNGSNWYFGLENNAGSAYGQYLSSGGQSASSPVGSYSVASGGTAPAPTVSTTPQSTSGGGSGGGSGGTSTAPGAPGVSASLSPYVIASGGASVLRWDTSGASSVTVTGVPNPSLSGTANVSPTATTTYTITATNSAGTTTQTVTLQVGGANAPGGDGVSTYTPGSGVTGLGAVSIAAPTVPAQTLSSGTTIPGITIPGLTIPGLSIPSIAGGSGISVPGLTIPGLTIPGLTLPGYTMPALSVPGLSLPGISLPGDLKIGIPGIGSIGIPSGWLTQIIAAGTNPSTIALGTLLQGVGYSNSLATYNAGAAVNQAVRDGTATLQQINSTSSAATQYGLNNVQAAVVNTASVVQGTIQQGTYQVQNTITSVEKTAVTDFQNMITAVLQAMFIPDPSVLQQFQTQNAAFVNWGPVAYVNSFVAALNTPAGDGSLGGGLPGLTVPGFNVNPGDAYIQLNPDGSTKSIPAGVYATGVNVPMDMTPFTSSTSWPAVYKLETAFVTLAFLVAIWAIYWPRQVF